MQIKKEVIENYQNNTYIDINQYLRDKRKKLFIFNSKDDLINNIKILDYATQLTPLQVNSILYRGINERNDFTKKLLSKGVGYKFILKAFTSTSLQKTEISNGVEYNFIINTKAGQFGINVNQIYPNGKWVEENEFILPRNTKFVITNISQSITNKYQTNIFVDIVI